MEELAIFFFECLLFLFLCLVFFNRETVLYHGPPRRRDLEYDISTKSPFSEVNRDRIFIAATFLKERIQLLTQCNTVLHNAEITKNNISIRCLAGDLHNFCTELQGVNSEALAD